MDFVTLETIIARDEKSISSRALYMLQQPLVEQLIALRDKHSGDGALTLDTVLLDTQNKSLKVTSVASDESANIKAYGNLLLTALEHSKYGNRRLHSIAMQCSQGEIDSLEEVHLLLEKMVSRTIYKFILAIIASAIAIMAILYLS